MTSSTSRGEDSEPSPDGDCPGPELPPEDRIIEGPTEDAIEDPVASELHVLFEEMFAELRSRAQRAMGHASAAHTLQPTALVNEAFLRMQNSGKNRWESRDHFLLTAAKVMRSVLIDHHRGKISGKRDKKRSHIELDLLVLEYEDRSVDYEGLDQALNKLAQEQPQMAEAIQMQFFAGATLAEISRILDIPKRTLDRKLQTVRAWLRLQLK